MSPLITNEQQVLDTLVTIRREAFPVPDETNPVRILQRLVEVCREAVRGRETVDDAWWIRWFSHVGQAARLALGSNFSEAVFAKMLLMKHQAYGPEPITRWAEPGVAIRIDSKVARVENLLSGSLPFGDESWMDTLRDIVGYCVLGLRMIEARRNQ